VAEKESGIQNELKSAEADLLKSQPKPDHETRKILLEAHVKTAQVKLEQAQKEKQVKKAEYDTAVVSRMKESIQTLYQAYISWYKTCLDETLKSLSEILPTSSVGDISLNASTSVPSSPAPSTAQPPAPALRPPTSSPEPTVAIVTTTEVSSSSSTTVDSSSRYITHSQSETEQKFTDISVVDSS
jgi:hypothetical protein